jgi:adenylate cyclase
LVNQHKGHVVDSPGDNVLAEFASVVDAVRCAVETQKQIAERNADLPENRRMLFRIGVNTTAQFFCRQALKKCVW